MSDSGITNEEISDALSDLAGDLVNLMIREHQYIHQELEHVRQLVGDAARSLTASFDQINILAIEQNTMITLALQLNTTDNESFLEQCKRVDNNHRENRLKIVTALQFDDIVQQLTSHAQNRAKNIQAMFKNLDETLKELKTLDNENSPELMTRIQDIKQDVETFRTELEKENPVKQTSLAIGKTELF